MGGIIWQTAEQDSGYRNTLETEKLHNPLLSQNPFEQGAPNDHLDV